MDDPRPECLSGTRQDVLAFIECWIATGSERVLWLHGVAGSGKSTIATTVANNLWRQGQLGAFLLFSRDIERRNHPKYVIRTIAYQLALFEPRTIGNAIGSVITETPSIMQMPLREQLYKLIVEPLSTFLPSKGPILLVLDGLDECGGAQDRRDLLDILAEKLKWLPPFVRIFITSRADLDVTTAFREQRQVLSHKLELASEHNINGINLFLRHRMNSIRSLKASLGLAADWPGDEATQSLGNRAPVYLCGHRLPAFSSKRVGTPESALPLFWMTT